MERIHAEMSHTPSAYERFRHSHWNQLRRMTFDVLSEAGASEKSLDRYAQCGACCQVSYSPGHKRLYLSSSNCKNRHCAPCAAARRATIARNLRQALEGTHLRLLTLTIAHHNRPLPELIDRIKASFKLLRKQEQWISHVTGFAAFIEVKWSDRSNWWHVHFHILACGSWWDRRELSATWHRVTGDSMVTDIREVTSDEGITYTAKYAAKPFELSSIPAEQRVTAVQAMGHRRLWQVGGDWKGKLKLLEQPDLPADLVPLGSFTSIVDDAKRGSLEATEVLEAILGGACTEITRVEDADDFSSA